MSGRTNCAVRAKRFSTIAATRRTQFLALVVVQIMLGIADPGRWGFCSGRSSARSWDPAALLRLAIGPPVVLAVLAPVLAGPVFGGDRGEARGNPNSRRWACDAP